MRGGPSKICQGAEIRDQLGSGHYYQGFLAKMWLTWDGYETASMPQFWIDPSPSDPDLQYWKFTKFYNRDKPSDIVCQIIKHEFKEQLDRWVLVSLYNTHHQQFMNPVFTAIHFDYSTKKMFVPWRYDQAYPGCWGYPRFDDEANIIGYGEPNARTNS